MKELSLKMSVKKKKHLHEPEIENELQGESDPIQEEIRSKSIKTQAGQRIVTLLAISEGSCKKKKKVFLSTS